MSALVVYYSLEGDTDMVAQKMAQKLRADIVRLTPEKEIPKEGFKKFFWGGKSVMFNEKPKLANDRIPMENYDTVIIGTPIWAGSVSPPVLTFLSQYKMKGKEIYLFACHAGGGASKCFEKMRKLLDGNTVVDTVDFVEPYKKKDDTAEDRIERFCGRILKSEA